MSLEIIEMKVADLVPYAMNAKLHPDSQVAQIAASIEEFGMNDPVAVWHDADGVPIIVEGHGRVLALQKLKRKTCPVICLDDLSDAQRRAYTLVHNQLTLNSGWDADKLETELESISNDIELGKFGLEYDPEKDTIDTGIDTIDDSHAIQINVNSEDELEEVFQKLTEEGYNCKIITI